MRHFNNFEKDIIRALLIKERPEDVCTVNLINKVLPIYVIAWSENYDTISLVIKKSEDFDLIRNKLFDIITLLRYLEEHQLIGIFPSQIASGNMVYDDSKYIIEQWGDGLKRGFDIWKKIPHGSERIRNIKWQNEKNGIGKDIEKFVNSTYHITQGLRDYVNNGFRTDEQIQFQRNYRLTIIAIIVAIGTGLGSIIVSMPEKHEEFDYSRQDSIYKILKHIDENISLYKDSIQMNKDNNR